MKWDALFEGISYITNDKVEEITIDGICCHTGKAGPNAVFVGMKEKMKKNSLSLGEWMQRKQNLISHLDEAANKLASILVMDDGAVYRMMNEKLSKNVILVLVADARKAYAMLCRNYFGKPDCSLKIIGITGTKGKTTTSFMIHRFLEMSGEKAGMIGSCGIFYGEKRKDSRLTTPDPSELFSALSRMKKEGIKYVVMEVSSQAMYYKRVSGIQFQLAIFTNFSADHISEKEHHSMEEYFFWKSRLFLQCDMALVNGDDKYFRQLDMMLEKEKKICYNIMNIEQISKEDKSPYNDFPNNDLSTPKVQKTILYFGKIYHVLKKQNPLAMFRVFTARNAFCASLGMAGEFNVQNESLAFACMKILGFPILPLKNGCENLRVPGRMEMFPLSNGVCVCLDYAHNETSLHACLSCLSEFHSGRIICVFGCGGNRSVLRRNRMGLESGLLSDFTIITEDNSRMEAFENIAAGIAEGISKTNGSYIVIENRRKAIQLAMTIAKKGDFVAVCGKGNEDYLEKMGKKIHFSDREEILNYAKICQYYN